MLHSKRRFALYITPAYRSSAGIERYARALLKGICQSELADRVVLLSARDSPPIGWVESLGFGRPPEARSKLPRRLLRYAWTFLGRPTADALAGEELAFTHNPVPMRTPTKGSPLVITLHDAIHARIPDWFTVRARLALTPQIQSTAVRNADHIIAISHDIKRDLVQLSHVPAERITVIHHGADHSLFRPVDDEDRIRRVLKEYGIMRRFILYVGSLYSPKIGKLLEAYKLLCARSKSPPKLVLIGGRESHGWREKDLASRLAALHLQQRVLLLGELPQERLPVFMSAAEVFVYVSVYEGFGLTPLEAMACGAPVIVSNTSALREVAGDAGVLVDPMNEQGIASAIERVLEDVSLREEMRRRSLARAALFSWERATQQTLDFYRRMLQ